MKTELKSNYWVYLFPTLSILCFAVAYANGVNILSSFIILAVITKFRPIFEEFNCTWTGISIHGFPHVLFTALAEFALFWHGFEIHGLDKIPANNTLLVGYHSRCTLDLFYLSSLLRPSIVGSHLFFIVPPVAWFFRKCGVISSKGGNIGSEKAFIRELSSGSKPVMLLPGGHEEFCHSISERYRAQWLREPGFARIIYSNHNKLGKNTKVIPFFIRNCEYIYSTTTWWHDFSGSTVKALMRDARRGQIWKIPVAMLMALFSLGNILLPVPVKLDTFFGKELTLRDGETIESFTNRVKTELHRLMDEVQQMSDSSFPREQHHVLILIIVGIYTLLQNLVILSLVLGLIVIGAPLGLLFRALILPLFSIMKGK
eukprot:gene6889-13967_t